MGAAAVAHPTDQVLQSYGLGRLDDVLSASVSKHLDGCDTCQRRVAELSSDDFLGRLQKRQGQAGQCGRRSVAGGSIFERKPFKFDGSAAAGNGASRTGRPPRL